MENQNREKKKKTLPKNLFWILGTFLLLLVGLTIILGVLGLNHKYFKIDNYVIKGNISHSDEEIISAMDIPANQSIFTLKTKDLEDRIITMGGVEAVEVKKVVPDSIIVKIVEDKNIGYVQVDDGYLLVGADLKISDFTDYLSEEDMDKMVKIVGAGYKSLAVGNEVSSLERENQFLQDLLNHVLFTITKEVDFSSENGKVLIKIKPDTLVRFGSLSETDYKLSVVEKIVSDLQNKEVNAKEIILDNTPNAVVVTD